MKKVVFMLFAMLSLLTVQLSVRADGQPDGIDAKRIYIGGGLGFNNLSGVGSGRGFQVFAGYDFNFKLNQDISSALEIGYMDSGKFEQLDTSGKTSAAKGLWVSMLESVALTNKTDMLARLGYDFGDDDGLLLGAGMQYKFDTKISSSMEYVVRNHSNGLQLNVRVRF